MNDNYKQFNFGLPTFAWTYFATESVPCLTNQIPINEQRMLVQKFQIQIKELQLTIEKLKQENRELRKQIKPKRRYSKRKIGLVKIFICKHQKCDKAYSSNIALQSHIKKKHKGFKK